MNCMKMPQIKPHARTRDNVNPRGRCRAFQETEPPTFMDESHENAQNRTLGPLTIHETPSIKRNTDIYPFSGWTVWKLQKWKRTLKPVTMWMRARLSRAFQGTETPISLQPHPTLTSIVLEIFRPPRFSFPCFQLFVPYPVFVHLDSIFHGAPRGYVVS